jgi:hypothetical protein
VKTPGSAATGTQRALGWASAMLAALCAARPVFAHSLALGAAACCALAASCAWAAPAGPDGTVARVALLLAGALVGLGDAARLGFAGPARAFFAQEAGQAPLLVLRVGLLLALVLASEAQAKTRRLGWLAGTGALLLLSLSFRGFLLPYCAFSLLGLGVSARTAPVTPPAPDVRATLAALALAALSLVGPAAPRPSATEPSAPAAAIAWWMQRANPYQAHYRALRWAREEQVPGQGFLALARLDVTLGRDDAAKKVLEKVVARATSEDARREAQRLREALERGAR